MSFHVPEQYRVTKGDLRSDASHGNNGAFFVPNRAARTHGYSTREFGRVPLKVIASDVEGWEHVSVSLTTRCPTWDEMCLIVEMFWDEGDCVMQLHPPRKDWISNHPYCLHLWRPTQAAIPRPPSLMVGYADLGDVLNGGEAVQNEALLRFESDGSNFSGATGSTPA